MDNRVILMNEIIQDLDLVKRTFSFDYETLPTISEIKSIIVEDDFSKFNKEKVSNTYDIRMEYCKHSFPILSHEFMTDLKELVDKYNFKDIHELSCGIGWLTYWARKYGINVKKAVDNRSWRHCVRFLPIVENKDSIDHVMDNPQADLFILSWPYMDEIAQRIWKSMKQGQYLLYIGESCGGCTANDIFFDKVSREGSEIDLDMWKNFISFYGVHDRPCLYRKIRYD